MRGKIIGIVIGMLLFTTVLWVPVPVKASSGDTPIYDDWSQFRHDINNSGFTTSTATITPTLEWKTSLGGVVQTSPAIVGGRVYIGSNAKKLYCLNATDGNVMWESNTGDILTSSPAVYEGYVYLGCHDSLVYCFNAMDGNQIWSNTTGGLVTSSPVVYGGYVCVGSTDGYVYCFNAENGARMWRKKLGALAIHSSPAFADGKLYIAPVLGKLYCLNPYGNGNILWSRTISVWLKMSPAVVDDYVYVGSTDNKVYCLEANDGDPVWNSSIGDISSSSPTVAYSKVYLGSNDHRIYCFDAIDGTFIWSYETNANVESSPAVADGKVYFGSNDNKVYCLDAEDGSLIWSYETGSSVTSSPAIADGYLYIGSNDGYLYCFGPNSPPGIPDQPDGPTFGEIDVLYTYETNPVSDPNEDEVFYLFDWGDLTISLWSTSPSASHKWIQEGVYHVKVKARDSYGAESEWSDELLVSIGITSTPEPPLIIDAPSSVVEGNVFQVTVTANGIPVSYASIEFDNATTLTDANGMLSLIAPEVETTTEFNLNATKEGYESASVLITVLNQGNVIDKGWIFGVVSNDFYAPLEGAKVCVMIAENETSSTSYCIFTNEQGRYNIILPVGIYTITTSAQGYQSRTITDIAVKDGEAIEVSFVLQEVSNNETQLPPNENRSLIDRAIQDQKVGGEVIIYPNGKNSVFIYSSMSILPIIQEESISLIVDSDEEVTRGKTIILDMDNEFLGSYDELEITYDGESIPMANNISDVLDSNDDNNITEYFLIGGEEETILLVSIADFSEHQITVQKIIETVVTIGLITAVILYVTICVVGVSAFLYPIFSETIFLRRKKKM